jgi:hypothetical protein
LWNLPYQTDVQRTASGIDRLVATVFVLTILSRVEDRWKRRRFRAAQAINAASRSVKVSHYS